MKLFFIILFFGLNSFAQNIVGFTFTTEQKGTLFPVTLQPFATDGCTKYDDGTKENPTLWQHCCFAHDMAYWLGGSEEERKASDEALKQCVADTGETATAKLMYLGTRVGGVPLAQNTYRWGFGWTRVRDYKILTAREIQMAYDMYGENLENLKRDISENKYTAVIPESYDYVSPYSYSFCEEEIINYLSTKLPKPTTVTKFNDFHSGRLYTISIGVDICKDPIEFQFTEQTDARSCKKDFAYHKTVNKFTDVRISNKCLKTIREK